MIDYVLCLSLV